MAAKKKSKKKTAAKKRPSPQKKKVSKKKSTKGKKSVTPKKSAKARKSSKSKTISVKKVAGKKRAPKKKKPIGFTVSKGPSIETMEAPAVAVQSMNLNALFLLGIGELSATLIRGGKELETQSLNQTGTIPFADVRAKDNIAISGTCTGSAEITTNRLTNPATDPANPRKFKDENFLELLKVK